MIYWDQASLNVMDSKILIETYKDTLSYYQLIYKLLVDNETSPYRTFTESKQTQLSMDEFLWAFNIVGSRSLILNNTPQPPTADPNAVMMILPILDFLNHSNTPNVIATPYHDKVSD